MQVICGIYFYRDLKEDEIVYVGQSRDIYQRHRGHLAPSSYNEQPINKIIQNNPVRYILEIERRCLPNELNDLEMMDSAYHSYAMDNAHDDLKKVARFIAKSNDECGVVQAIKESLNI